MFVAGLTGGIGSGKTTLAGLLAELGAHVIDADVIGREALRPGEPAWQSVVNTFGSDILAEGSMEIDRGRLAEIVFTDRNKLAALNQIVHPVIAAQIAERLERLQRTDDIVVLDAALIVELGLEDVCDVLVVVEAPEELRRARLHEQRNMSAADIGARMAAQAGPELLREQADLVVTNPGTIEELSERAREVWDELQEMARR